MTKELKSLAQTLGRLSRLAEKGELDDLPIATYRNLRSASMSALRWHDRYHQSDSLWGCVAALSGLVVAVLLGSYLGLY